jgi:hypothetical protein
MILIGKTTYDFIISEMGRDEEFEYFNAKEVTKAATQSELIDLCNKPKNISYKDGELHIVIEKDGVKEEVRLEEFDLGVEHCGKWLSEAIMQPPFDINQDGNVRKSGETESAFICCVIVAILDDKYFRSELTDVLENYDYTKMAPMELTGSGFKSLLQEWLKLNSFIINVIVSACRKKISDQKKDGDKFLRDGLTQEELIGLKDLQANISRVIYQYTGPKGELNPDNLRINNLQKVQILQLLDKQNKEIETLVGSSKFGTIWKIFHLSTEFIDPIVKKRLNYVVLDKVNKFYENSLEKENTDKNEFIKKLNARVLKVQRTSLRRSEILKYIKDPNSYLLPSKL